MTEEERKTLQNDYLYKTKDKHVMTTDYSDWLEEQIEQLKERIKQLEVEMKYARTFVSSHEKMHKDGLILYDLVLDANDKKQNK